MAGAIGFAVRVDGAVQLQRALRVLAENDAPHLRKALEQAGRLLRGAGARRAPGGIANAVDFVGVKGNVSGLRAVVRIKHPGSRSMEFGRIYYYRDFTGRRMKATGRRVAHNPGQKARPYMGVIKGGGALDEVRDDVQRLITEAIHAEWERIGAQK